MATSSDIFEIDDKTNTNDINKFISGKLVATLNAVRDFAVFHDAYEHPYNEIPEAAKNKVDEGEHVDKKGFKAKLEYELRLDKAKIANKWEPIARQITGTISKMLSEKVHNKVRTVYHSEWNTVINSGQVAKMIKYLRNGLTLKTSTVTEIDKLELEREFINFERKHSETIAECNERYGEILARWTSLECKPLQENKKILIYVNAQKRYYGNSKQGNIKDGIVIPMIVFLDKTIENLDKTMQIENKKQKDDENLSATLTLINVMDTMIETEARVMAYQPQTQEDKIIEEEAVMSIERKGAKANTANRNGGKFNKNDNPNTQKLINKWLQDKVVTSYHEGLKKVKCDKCKWKWHVTEDCRSKPREKSDNNNTSTNKKQGDNNAAYHVSISLDQAMKALEYYQNNDEVMMLAVDNKPNALKQYHSNRYNLDNHANIMIFNNPELVYDIEDTECSANVMGGIVKLNKKCTHPIFGKGFLEPSCKYNLLGLKALNNMKFTEFKPREALDQYTFLTHPEYGDIKLSRSVISDFYSIGHDELMRAIRNNVAEVKLIEAYPCLQVDTEYTLEEYKRAEEITRIHSRLGHPSNDTMKAILDHNLMVNTTLTSHDVNRAEEIFGPCETCRVCKPMKITNQFATMEPIRAIRGEVVHLDIMFINKNLAYLVAVEATVDYIMAWKVTNKEDILQQIELMLIHMHLKGHVVKVIRCDSDRVLISQNIKTKLAQRNQPVDVKASIPGEHEKLAESNIARIRVRMLCIAYYMCYELPMIFVHFLVLHAIDTLNFCPNAKIKDASPYQMIEKRKPNYITDLTISFGAACIVRNTEDNNKLHANKAVAIALGRSTTHTGGIYVWIPGKKQILVRRKLHYTKLTRSMINAINLLESAPVEVTIPPTMTLADMQQQQSTTAEQPETLTETQQQQPTTGVEPEETHSQQNIDKISQAKTATHSENSDMLLDVNNELEYYQEPLNNNNKRKRVSTNKNAATKQQKSSDKPIREENKIMDLSNNSHVMQTRKKTRSNIYAKLAVFLIEEKTKLDNERNENNKLAADYLELKQLLEFMTFKFLHTLGEREKSIHEGIIPSRMIRTIKYYKGKYLKHKSRLTAGGHKTNHENYTLSATSAPTVSHETLMIQLTLAVKNKMNIASIDFQAAYLNAEATTGQKHVMKLNKYESSIICKLQDNLREYIQPDGTMLVQLEKTLYGLPESGKKWYTLLTEYFIEIGFIKCQYEPTLMKRNDDIITIHVDDLLLSYNNVMLMDEITQFFQEKRIPLTIKYLTTETPLEHLGVIITKLTDGTIALSQKHYIEKEILDIYKPMKTYKTPATNMDSDDSNEYKLMDKNEYLQKLMKLYYIAARTRPDILTAVSYAAATNEPTTLHDNKLNRIIGYLKETQDMQMHITQTDLTLFAQFDASFATHEDMKSHSGKLIYVGNIPIFYKSTKQQHNARASAHSELHALYDGLDTLLWCRAVLAFMEPKFDSISPTKIYQDNKSTIRITELGKASSKTNSRFINCRVYWIKDLVENNVIDIQYLPSDQMVADALASIRTGAAFTTFRDKMQIYGIEMTKYNY